MLQESIPDTCICVSTTTPKLNVQNNIVLKEIHTMVWMSKTGEAKVEEIMVHVKILVQTTQGKCASYIGI